jgi:hypothetical protein
MHLRVQVQFDKHFLFLICNALQWTVLQNSCCTATGYNIKRTVTCLLISDDPHEIFALFFTHNPCKASSHLSLMLTDLAQQPSRMSSV